MIPVPATVEWYTPAWVFERLGLSFDLDPCSPDPAPAWIPARRTVALAENGLALPWSGRVWLNPPYGTRWLRLWLPRFIAHGDGVCLLPARTDADWFHGHVVRADLVCFTDGRICFVDAQGREGKQPMSGSLLLACGRESVAALQRAAFGWCVAGSPHLEEALR